MEKLRENKENKWESDSIEGGKMHEPLVIDCPELSGIGGTFISERSCRVYRELNNCPETCAIVATMPLAATSTPSAESNTEHSGGPDGPNVERAYQKGLKKAAYRDNYYMVMVDFTAYPEAYEKLQCLAKAMVRRLGDQLVWMVIAEK